MKAQIAMEFALFIGVVALFFGVAIAVINNQKLDLTSDIQLEVLEDFSYSVQKEFFTAAIMHDGFQRDIELPEKLNTDFYNITIINNNLYVTQDDKEIILPLPQVSGNINKSNITITKENDVVAIT